MADFAFQNEAKANQALQSEILKFVQMAKQEFKNSKDISKPGAVSGWVSVEKDPAGWAVLVQGRKAFLADTLSSFSTAFDSSSMTITFRTKPANYEGAEGLSQAVFNIKITKSAKTIESPERIKTQLLFDIKASSPSLEPVLK